MPNKPDARDGLQPHVIRIVIQKTINVNSQEKNY
jgi:hypothetical protein